MWKFREVHRSEDEVHKSSLLSHIVSKIPVPLSEPNDLAEILRSITDDTKNEEQGSSKIQERVSHLVQALKSVLEFPSHENAPSSAVVISDSEYLLKVSSAISQVITECSNPGEEGYTDESFWLACRHFEICSALMLAPESDELRFHGRIEHLLRELRTLEIGTTVLSEVRNRLSDPISVPLPNAERMLSDSVEESDVSKTPDHPMSVPNTEWWNNCKEFLNHCALTLQMIAPAALWELPLSLMSYLNPLGFTRSLNPGKKEPKFVTAGSVITDLDAETPLFTLAFETPEPNGRVTRLDQIFHPVSISAKELQRDRLPGEIDVTLPVKYAKHGVPVPIGYTIIGFKGDGTLLRSEYDTWKLDRQGGRSREICYRLKKSELHPPALVNNSRLLETKERVFVHPATERALFFASEVQSSREKIGLLLEGLEVADATYTRDPAILGKIARAGRYALEWSDSLQLYICDNLAYSFCFTAREAKVPTAIVNGLLVHREDNGIQSLIVSESHAKISYLDETGAPIEVEPQDGLSSSFPSHRNAMKGDWVDHFLKSRSSRGRFFNLIDIGKRWRIGASDSLKEESSNSEIQEIETTQLDIHKARYTVRILSEIEKRLTKSEIGSDIESLLKILARIRHCNPDLIKQEFGIQGGVLPHERISIAEAQHVVISEICEKVKQMPDKERADAVRLIAREYFEERQGGNESESITLEPYWILTILNSSTQHHVRLSPKAYDELLQSAGYNAARKDNPRLRYLEQVEASDTFFTSLLENQGVKKIGRRNTQLRSQAISAGIWMVLRVPIEQDPGVKERISVLIDNVYSRAQRLRVSKRELEIDILETLFNSPFPIDEASIEQRKWISGHLIRHARTSHLFDSEDRLSPEALTLFRERLYRNKLENKRLTKWNLFPVHLFSNMRRMGFDFTPLIDTSDLHFDGYLKTFMQGASLANQDTHTKFRLPRGMMIAGLHNEVRFPLRRFFSLSSDSQSEIRFSAIKEQIRFGCALHSVSEEPNVRNLIHSLSSIGGQEAEFFATTLIKDIDQDSFRSHRGDNGYAMFSFQSGGVSFALPFVSAVSSVGDGGDFIIGHDDSTRRAYMAIPVVYRDFFESLFDLKGIGSELRRINLAEELTNHLTPQEIQMFPILWALMPSVPETEGARTHEEKELIASNYARFDRILNGFLARKELEVQAMCKAYINLGFSDNGISTHSLVRTVYDERERAIRTHSLWLPFSEQQNYRDPLLNVFFRFVPDIDLNNAFDLYDYSAGNAQPLERQIRALFNSPSNTKDGAHLRELREYQPGDALSRISWAATARTGRMISKEMESADSLSKKIVVDLDWLGQGVTLGDPGRNLPVLLGFLHAASRQPEPTSLTVVFGGKIAYYLSNAELKQSIRSPGSLTMNLWKLAALANELKLHDDGPRLLFNADVKLHAQESLFVFASPRSSDATRKVYRHLSRAHASAHFLRN